MADFKAFRDALGTTITFERADHTYTVKVADLPDEMLVRLCAHGVKQKVGDAAAGKEGAKALDAMHKAFAALKAGEWTDKASQLLAMARTIIRSAVGGDVDAIRNAGDLGRVCNVHGIDPKKVLAKAAEALAKRNASVDDLK